VDGQIIGLYEDDLLKLGDSLLKVLTITSKSTCYSIVFFNKYVDFSFQLFSQVKYGIWEATAFIILSDESRCKEHEGHI
jgi:hypothetical protein